MKRILILMVFIGVHSCLAADIYNVGSDGTNLFSKGGGGAFHPLTNLNVSIIITNNFGWEDLRFSAATAARLNPAAKVELNTEENAIDYKTTCDTNITDEHTFYIAELPHAWNIGGDIGPHVHFLQSNADQTNMWYMYCRWINRAATNDTWTFIGPATNEYAYAAGTMHQVAEFGFLSGVGMTASSILDVKIMRDGNFGTGTVPLKEFDIHYEVRKPTGQPGVYE